MGRRIYDFFFQAEDGIRYSVASRGLGDVYKGQSFSCPKTEYGSFLSTRRETSNVKVFGPVTSLGYVEMGIY